MKKRFISLFLVAALCLGLLPTTALADAVVVVPPGGGDGDISVDVTPDEPGNVTVIVPGEDGGDVVVVIPPDEKEPELPAIGDVVNFAGHEWYIIGTDDAADGGVTAPEGCYTLFAKNNDFGSTAYRAGNEGDRFSTLAVLYNGSDLQKAMEEIADGFSETDKAAIVPRDLDEDDDIWGDPVEDQLLWPIGGDRSISDEVGYVTGEAGLIGESIRQFETIYWGRTGSKSNVIGATDTFVTPSPEPGEPTPTPTPVPTPAPPYIDKWNSYSVIAYNADGSEKWDGTAGVLSGELASYANNSFAIRPALYVRAEAVTGGAEASPVIGDTVSFAGHEWYLIGTGIGGVTAPEGCYTLFAKNNDFGSTAFRAGAETTNVSDNYYIDSDLQKKMEGIASGFSTEDKTNIAARATLDGISGDSPTNQLLWAISEAEWESINQSVRAFPADYWTRGYKEGQANFSAPYCYNAVYANANGRILGNGQAATLIGFPVTNSYAVRPALYVKAEAVGAPKVTESITGGETYFGNQNWYIVGMGDTGLVPGPSNTVTLFADSIVEGQYATTNIHYSQGDLCAAMKNLGASLNLSAQAQSLISSRTLTAADEITGDPVTTPFWPLSKSEFEAIQAENSSLLMGASWSYWLRTEAPSKWEIHRTVYAGDANGTLTQNSTPDSELGVRPAFYLDLSTLFFAAGESSMGNSVDGNPVKLMPPGADSSQKRWNFVMYDKENLTLTMSAVQGQSGQSLTFQYSGTGGVYHSLAYVLEQDGVPVYYGNAASLKDSGSGTVTVPLLGSSSKLEDGVYTMRFYEEDRTDGIYFASDTVDLQISVGNGVASITYMGEVTVHTHNYGTELKYDENNHWRECACGAKTTPQAHDYGNDQDETCNICGYEREVVHQHTLQWLFSSAAGHWQQCIFCNEIMTPVEPHVYDNDQDLTCNVCDYERQPPHTHDFGNSWESDAFGHWQECSCGEKTTAQAHTYDDEQDPTCIVCGYERELSHTHDFGTDWGSDAFNHWHKCSTCGARDAEAAHSYGDDQDTTCNICGYVRDLSHTHWYSNSWKCDTISHWHECISCGARSAEAAHVYDNDLDAECNVCTFKRVISHVHQGVLVSGTPATCTQEGSKAYYTCTCQQNFEDEACTILIADLDSWKVIPAGHTWSDACLAENADESKHYHVCTVCNVKDEGEAHTWNAESATEQNDKHCTICGYVAEEQLEHTHTYGTEWKSDADTHWHECSCGEKADEAAHTYGESDTCTICGYVRPAAPEYTVTFNANGGSVSPSSAVTTDGKLTALPIPTRSGYDFVGWYTTASGGDRVTVNTVFTKNTTIYAYWEKQSIGGGDDPIILPSKTPSEEVREDIENAQEGDTVEVTLKPGKTELGGEVFEELAGKNITLEITVPGGVMWMVNGQDIPTDTDLTDIDMGVSMNTSTIPVDLINMVTGEMGAVQITLAHDGEFGFALTLSAPLGKENAGYWANLYHYDENAKTLNYETSAQVASDGTASLRMTHASQYAIVIDDKSHELPFTDTTKGTWYQGAVEYVYRNGIMTGTSATTFQPNGTLSRAMAVQIFYNLEGQPDISDENLGYPYEDVNAQAWYGDAVYWARLTGVATGYGDGTFQPGDSITRQEFAQMLYNYAKYKGYDLSAEGDLSQFPDSGSVADWAEAAMSWANGNQLINGHDDGTLEPGGTTTRAQAASILMRFDQNVVEN